MKVRAIVALMLLGAATPAMARDESHTAPGDFTVVLGEPIVDAADGGVMFARRSIKKTFTGWIKGSATGTMMSTMSADGSGAYVALDRFEGVVNARRGGFTLVHRGTMRAGGKDAKLDIAIVPGSGTGALTGIAGTMEITQKDGQHHAELDYTLPAG